MIRDIAIGDPNAFAKAITVLQKRQVAWVQAYQTAEEAKAYFRDEPSVLDEIEDWLLTDARGPVVARRDDEFAQLWIALDDDCDWLELHLRWSEKLSSAIRPRSA